MKLNNHFHFIRSLGMRSAVARLPIILLWRDVSCCAGATLAALTVLFQKSYPFQFFIQHHKVTRRSTCRLSYSEYHSVKYLSSTPIYVISSFFLSLFHSLFFFILYFFLSLYGSFPLFLVFFAPLLLLSHISLMRH